VPRTRCMRGTLVVSGLSVRVRSDDRAVLDVRRTPATEAAPAVPEDQREQQPDGADDHQDHTDGVDVEAVRIVDRDAEVEDRTHGDEEQAGADAHEGSPLSRTPTGYPTSPLVSHAPPPVSNPVPPRRPVLGHARG